jgi:glutamate-1-semialdehyde aminotransferase
VRKTHIIFGAHFVYTEHDQFSKTGSGQTEGKLNREFVSASGNSLTLAAGLATLKALTPAVYEHLDQLGQRLQDGLRCGHTLFFSVLSF